MRNYAKHITDLELWHLGRMKLYAVEKTKIERKSTMNAVLVEMYLAEQWKIREIEGKNNSRKTDEKDPDE